MKIEVFVMEVMIGQKDFTERSEVVQVAEKNCIKAVKELWDSLRKERRKGNKGEKKGDLVGKNLPPLRAPRVLLDDLRG